MRKGIGIAVIVAMGLLWSVAVMSQWNPPAHPDPLSHSAARPTAPHRSPPTRFSPNPPPLQGKGLRAYAAHPLAPSLP
jgi:hypothetical protein